MQITRYMKFSWFLDVIEKGLYIPKATCFDDKWEGLLSSYSSQNNSIHENSVKYTRSHLEWIYISSWTMESIESYAMWKIYAGEDLSVAIVTTSEKLEALYKRTFPNTEAKFNAVEYHVPGRRDNPTAIKCISHAPNIDPDVNGSMLFLFRKHKTYVFEKEIRLVCLHQSPRFTSCNPEPALRLPFVTDTSFLDRIIVSPAAPKALFKIIQRVISEKSMQTVAYSQLEVPVYSEEA